MVQNLIRLDLNVCKHIKGSGLEIRKRVARTQCCVLRQRTGSLTLGAPQRLVNHDSRVWKRVSFSLHSRHGFNLEHLIWAKANSLTPKACAPACPTCCPAARRNAPIDAANPTQTVLTCGLM